MVHSGVAQYIEALLNLSKIVDNVTLFLGILEGDRSLSINSTC